MLTIEVAAVLWKADKIKSGMGIKDLQHFKYLYNSHASIKDLEKFRPL